VAGCPKISLSGLNRKLAFGSNMLDQVGDFETSHPNLLDGVLEWEWKNRKRGR